MAWRLVAMSESTTAAMKAESWDSKTVERMAVVKDFLRVVQRAAHLAVSKAAVLGGQRVGKWDFPTAVKKAAWKETHSAELSADMWVLTKAAQKEVRLAVLMVEL